VVDFREDLILNITVFVVVVWAEIFRGNNSEYYCVFLWWNGEGNMEIVIPNITVSFVWFCGGE
jgi:hypothetical protein